MQKTSYILCSRYIVTRVIITVLFSFLTVLIVNATLPIAAESKSVLYKEKREQFKNTADSLNAVSVGNSHGLAFHFSSMGLNGMHFWETAGDMEETLYKINGILNHTQSLEYVFLPLSPGSLSTSQRVLSNDYATRKMRVSNDLPFSWDWRMFSLEDIVGSMIFNYFPINIIQDMLYGLIGYNSSVQLITQEEKNACFKVLDSKTGSQINVSNSEDGILDGYRHALILPECIMRFARRKARDTKRRVEKTIRSNPEILLENTQRVLEIADLTAAAGAKLVVVLPPMTKASYMTPEIQSLVANFEQAISTIKVHENVAFFDFHDLYFERVDESRNPYFYDAEHLAITGSKDFSKTLKNEMRL